MSGIYLHIPFCKLKCHYCDFHFSTKIDLADKLVDAIVSEIELKRNYLPSNSLSTIYFGGGTPSILTKNQLAKIFDCIHSEYKLEEDCEITLECNPDDLDREKIKELISLGVNRLSIGTQSFDNDVLEMMNRAHNRDEAIKSIQLAKELGIDNITIDLIYGVPTKDLDYWKNQIDIFLELDVPHLSAYCLTIENKTLFGHKHKKGELNLPSDEVALEQFTYLVDRLREKGYEQYEISNFAKEGYISKHNSAYWLGKQYLGIGPSAHSFNGEQRSWNIANNHEYVRQINDGVVPSEIEVLSEKDKVNDYLITRLRTKWGISEIELTKLFENLSPDAFKKNIETHLKKGNLSQTDTVIRLTEKGKFISDNILSDLLI